MSPKKKETEPADPDTLIRRKAGTYRTADDRFEIQEAATGWFLVDSTAVNDFGQPLMQGPFGTLAAVREALPGARKTTSLPRRPTRRSQPKAAASGPTPAAPPSWIDRLASAEAREVRRLIRALEREGFTDAESEALARRDRDGLLPAVASRLIERRLEALVAEQPPDERDRAQELVGRAAEILSADGMVSHDPLPRWSLVEVGVDGEPRNRRIVVGR